MAEARARLTYFAGWGLAEQTRWVLAATNVEWDQVVFEKHEEFLALKDSGKLLFGQMPLLELDGLNLVQSQAMVRYVGRRGGLSGKTPAEEALIDMVCEGVKDARGGAVVGFPFKGDDEKAAAELPAAIERNMKCCEAVLAKSNGHVVASGLSTADVLLAEMAHECEGLVPGSMSSYPLVKAVHDEVVQLPGVVAYLASDKRFTFPLGEVGKVYVANVRAVLSG